MDKREIINILKAEKKYSGKNFEFIDSDCVIYTIDDRKYDISCYDDWKTFSFIYSKYNYNIQQKKSSFIKKDADRKRILAKFREVVRYLNKLHIFLENKEKHLQIVTTAVNKYLKEEYYLENIDYNNKFNVFRMTFPKSSFTKNGRYKTTFFDPIKETPNKIIYNIFVVVYDFNVNYVLELIYNTETNKLILTRKEEKYNNSGKDITKIIRSEKLKKILFFK
jgi:hypothetical protein